MDLMGDLGAADQLMSAREENKILKAKVKECTETIKELRLTNAQLQAEVEMYREEAALPSFSNMALGNATTITTNGNDMEDLAAAAPGHDFVSSGDGTYPNDPAVTLPHIHGISNPLCCALDKSDSILGTGGADSYVSIIAWGTALAPGSQASADAVLKAARVACSAPVISIAFSTTDDILAVGCMDGTVHLIGYAYQSSTSTGMRRLDAWTLKVVSGENIKFNKYVKSLAFAPNSGLLASSSADGTVQLTRVTLVNNAEDGDEDMDCGDANATNEGQSKNAKVELVNSLHLTGAVETVCFVNDGNTLCLYERETSYLSYFDLNDDFKMTKYSLNGPVTGGFDSHVSFAVMDIAVSPNGKYLCAATDASRNIILEVGTSNIIRDLYGHKNDGFSQPRIAWSRSGKYIYGNTQEDSSVCVWDIASAKMVNKLKSHQGQLRDMFSSRNSDTVVTSAYDKSVKVWLNEM